MGRLANRRGLGPAVWRAALLGWGVSAFFLLLCPGRAAPDRSASWPAFHGLHRDNLSLEKGLLKKWPEGGPQLLWRFSDCGAGYSSVSIAGGRIFTAGDFRREELVIALDMKGELLWRSRNGKSWTGPQPGARTTPTYDDGVLYHMNPTGRLAAFRAATGEELWAVDVRARFDGRYGVWAMAENVLVDGDRLFCTPGGAKGRVAALDKKTGATIWANTELDDGAAYCSPVLVTYRGVRQIITLMQKSVVSIDAQEGKLLWSYPHVTPYDQNVTSPVFHDGYVFVTSGHHGGGRLLRIDPDLHGATEVWFRREFDNCHGGVILAGGRLYGSGCRLGGQSFFCFDFLEGTGVKRGAPLDKLSLTCADGMLYGLSYKGEMVLLAISAGGFEIAGEFDVPSRRDRTYFAHPVVCGGRLYLRHGRDLLAYDIRAGALSSPPTCEQ